MKIYKKRGELIGDFSPPNLSYADLIDANLSYADLSDANLSYANLIGANLSKADLRYANLSYANLIGADLSYADLSGTDLSGTNLSRADLSGATGLLSAIDFIGQLEKTKDGIIAYKRIGHTTYGQPEHWKIFSGSILTEVVNYDRCLSCACGVNVGTKEWCDGHYDDADLWKVLIKWEDLAGVCVPYNTDGKFRAERVQLVELVEKGQ